MMSSHRPKILGCTSVPVSHLMTAGKGSHKPLNRTKQGLRKMNECHYITFDIAECKKHVYCPFPFFTWMKMDAIFNHLLHPFFNTTYFMQGSRDLQLITLSLSEARVHSEQVTCCITVSCNDRSLNYYCTYYTQNNYVKVLTCNKWSLSLFHYAARAAKSSVYDNWMKELQLYINIMNTLLILYVVNTCHQ